jgi:hypothetical protein
MERDALNSKAAILVVEDETLFAFGRPTFLKKRASLS